jgi:hypothetical protein
VRIAFSSDAVVSEPALLDRELEAAYHQAGHVAVARSLGCATHGVTISEDGKGSHSYHWSPSLGFQPILDISGRVRNRLETLMMIALAGHESTRLHLGVDAAIETQPEYSGVWRMALCLARGEKHEAAALIEWLRRRTFNVLDQHDVEIEVEVIAQALLDRKSLTNAEIKQLCSAQSPR